MAIVSPPRPKVDKIEVVLLQRKDETSCHRGTLRLTSHHLIFEYGPDAAKDASDAFEVPYSLIGKATKLPSLRIVGSSGVNSRIHPILIHQKNFDACAFGFASETAQLEVFESLKECAVLLDTTQLYAFHYQPQASGSSATRRGNGWKVYDFKKEFTRQGIGSRSKAWRFTDINAQYTFSPTYPAQMVVPSRISDATLGYASKYRSKARIPALTYLHWANQGSITRSSQPMVGLKNARSIQDEKLIEAIFTSHHFADPNSMAAKAAAEATANAASSGGVSTLAVYGATSTNLIVDARPTTNAVANMAKGAGTENMEYYKGCKKAYLGIDNIHVMRDSLNRLTDALRESEPPATFGMKVEVVDAAAEDSSSNGFGSAAVTEATALPIDPTALRKSYWLKHIVSLLEGSMTIVRNVHINSSHVVIHCSDGWDRTSQLAAIAELCLDPYYRTFEGLAVLIEKDWLSFGHQFGDRGGLKGNEKYFVTAARGQQDDDSDRGSIGGDNSEGEAEKPAGGFDGQAAANAFWGFTKQLTANFSSGHSSGPHRGSHNKETSPVFHQFLDCIWQIMRQFPQRFEFSAEYLVELLKVSQECKFGTFLMNCERERLRPVDEEGRVLPALPTKTVSAWDSLLAEENKARFANKDYKPEFDNRDPKRQSTDMGVLFADAKDVRYFESLFKRQPNEMNAALDREAEERRRARERLERAVRGEAEEHRGLEPGEAEVTVADVEAGNHDPVLDAVRGDVAAAMSSTSSSKGNPPGAVDLTKGKIDHAKLAYQPRKPRAAPSTLKAPLASSQEGAADAVKGMKNLLLGGWGRLQDAVAGQPSSPGSSPSVPVDDPWRSSGNVTARPPPQPQQQAPASTPQARGAQGYHNPWAKTEWRDELQQERERMNAIPTSSSQQRSETRLDSKAKPGDAIESDPLGVL